MEDSKKIYKFQKRFIYIETFFFSLLFTTLILSWLPTIIGIFAYGVLFPSAIRFGFFLDVTSLIALFLILFIKNELRKTAFIITDDTLIHKFAGTVMSIPLSDIVLCKLSRNSFFRKSIQISSAKQTIFLPFYINGIHDLLLDIHEGLIANGSAKAIEESTVQDMFANALYRKFAYIREKKAYFLLICTTIFISFFNLIIGYKYWEMDLIPVIMWTIIGFILPLGSFGAAEFLINRFIKKTTPVDKIATNTFTSYYILSGLFFLMIYLLTGIIFQKFF